MASSSSSTCIHNLCCLLMPTLVILLALPPPSFPASLPATFTFAYQDYCRSFMPASTTQHSFSPPSSGSNSSTMRDLSFRWGAFSGGFPFFYAPPYINDHSSLIRLSVAGKAEGVMQHENQADGYDVVDGSIALHSYKRSWSGRVKGVWIAHSGYLCLAACFHNPQAENQVDCKVKIIFTYPAKPSITQPLVKGKLESQRNPSDPLFFQPITVIAVPDQPYVFSKTEQLRPMCASQHRDVPPHINVLKDESAACRLLPSLTRYMDIVWQPQCKGLNCNVSGGNNRASPGRRLLGQKIKCQHGLVHGYFVWDTNWGSESNETSQGLLAIEGQWDSTQGQFCMSACNFNGVFGDSLTLEPPDCDILVTLQLPTSMDLIFQNVVVGQVKRSQINSASSSFHPFSFRSTFKDFRIDSLDLPEMKYLYTSAVLRQAQNKCEAGSADKEEESKKKSQQFSYSDGTVSYDLGFSVSLNGGGGQVFFNPLSIDDRVENVGAEIAPLLSFWEDHINVSFTVHDASPNQLVSAEGVYNRRTGLLCLIACRILDFSAQDAHRLEDGTDKDCQVHVTIQYPPTNPSFLGHHGIRGRIISLREHADPHFFAPIPLSSDLKVYQQQAFGSIHQINSEIVIGFISLTMAAVFVGAQRHHAKRRPSILPHVSMLMLAVLTLGYLILLVSNFNAIIPQRTTRVVPMSRDQLQLSEVLVRIMATVVCLLLLRLVHLAWGSKCAMSTTEGPWHMERKVLYVCLAAHAFGGVIAWIVRANRGKTLVGAMKAYAGFTVDFFLFPQVVANCVWGVEDRVLSPSFYFGMTLLRSFPHLYDIVRGLRFVPRLSSSYYYANPAWDYYSSAWNAIIPCGALLLAVLVFFQQRYGGSFILPRCWRQETKYEKISITAP